MRHLGFCLNIACGSHIILLVVPIVRVVWKSSQATGMIILYYITLYYIILYYIIWNNQLWGEIWDDRDDHSRLNKIKFLRDDRDGRKIFETIIWEIIYIYIYIYFFFLGLNGTMLFNRSRITHNVQKLHKAFWKISQYIFKFSQNSVRESAFFRVWCFCGVPSLSVWESIYTTNYQSKWHNQFRNISMSPRV